MRQLTQGHLRDKDNSSKGVNFLHYALKRHLLNAQATTTQAIMFSLYSFITVVPL